MEKELPPSWESLLDRLMESPTPLRLHDLTIDDRIALSSASIHRNLMAMVEAGIIRREGDRKNAVYAPIEQVEVVWTAKFGDRWRRMVWQTKPPMDWRHPLVGRISDGQARAVIHRFLEALEDAGLTWPWTLVDEGTQNGEVGGKLGEHRDHAGITVIVFGSCARGDARPDSDVDLLVIAPYGVPEEKHQGPEKTGRRRNGPLVDCRESILDIAAGINLGASRVLDITFAGRDQTGFTVPSALRQDIIKDGVTVFTTQGTEEFVEGWPKNKWDDQ